MAAQKKQILIVEDDNTLATSMQEAFKRQGFETHVTSSLSESAKVLRENPIGTAFVDCLLPEGSGVEWVEQIRSQFPEAILDVVLMSGILSNGPFIKESIRSAKAKDFLVKPFEMKAALDCLVHNDDPNTGSGVLVHPRRALYQAFAKGHISVTEKKKLIEAVEDLHGFDLPFLYSLIVEAESSGNLYIKAEKGEEFKITFAQGHIIRVEIPDRESFLGKLLIDGGYVHPDDLEAAIEDKTSNLKLGERLVQSSYVSPHALSIVLGRQLNIRLSRTIIDEKITVRFEDSDFVLTNPVIDPETFYLFLHDWIASKITTDWLKAHYTQWSTCPVVKTPLFQPNHEALQMPLVFNMRNVEDFLTSGKTLSQLVDSGVYLDEVLYKAIHLFLSHGIISFAEPLIQQTPQERLKYLNKIAAQFQNKNRIGIYDLLVRITSGSEGDPEGVFNEFRRILGEVSLEAPQELQMLHGKLTSMAKQVYEFAKSGALLKQKEDMIKTELEGKLKSSQYFEEAKAALEKAQHKQAYELLKRVQSVDPQMAKLRIYLAWAKLGLIDTVPDREKFLREIEMDLVQIPPEEKFDSYAHFVQGLQAKARNDFNQAKKHFEKAIALDKNMIVARRELTSLASQKMASKDIKNVFGNLFGKK